MRFFNTATKQKEVFTSESKNLGLYICGPTVYSDTHLGHAKSYVSFDVLKRWLGYKGYEVNHDELDGKAARFVAAWNTESNDIDKLLKTIVNK